MPTWREAFNEWWKKEGWMEGAPEGEMAIAFKEGWARAFDVALEQLKQTIGKRLDP